MNSQLPFRFKVCGLTRAEDIVAAARSGVDAIGLNFVERSPRCISMADARKLAELCRQHSMQVVAVVMDASADALAEIVAGVAPDFIQLHGRERPESVGSEVPSGTRLIKAVSWSGREEERQLALAWADDNRLAAFLVDAYAPVEGGGTGKRAAWELLQVVPKELASRPVVLAGGLNPISVGDGIRATCATAVDTASGVETSPGVKDAEQMSAFVAAAQRAFDD